MKSKIVKQVEKLLSKATTEEEILEISRIIEEAKGRLRLVEGDRGFWEGKMACWEMFACPPELTRECPAATYRSAPCWEIEGTYTKLSDDGMKGDDTKLCKSCRVYRTWGHGEPIRIKLVGRGLNIRALIAVLSNRDGLVRRSARRSLVAIGKPAVPALIEALTEADPQVRWEAAKGLKKIRDPAAARSLVKSLEDDVFEVRWLAAEGLIALGRDALLPLLMALVVRPDAPWLRQGAHHVLHDLAEGDFREVLQPLLAALEHLDAVIEAPLVARAALQTLTKTMGCEEVSGREFEPGCITGRCASPGWTLSAIKGVHDTVEYTRSNKNRST